ncbi:MAG: pilin, partial [Candidatus Moraniibacteriota bacterium]
KAPQVDDACTAGGGTCRSDYYNVYFPGEPVCGYGTGVPLSLACGGGPGRMCCQPPPNVGAICNGGPDTCQLPGNCAIGGYADGACFGGTVCCPPPPAPTLSSFVVPASCTIAVGASDCPITVSWSINNPVAPALRLNGNLISNLASSPGLAATLSFGLNIFELSDGATSLSIQPASAVCAAGSSWDGALCAATPPPPATCTGAATKVSGTCRGTCLAGEFADVDGTNCPGISCCTLSPPPPPPVPGGPVNFLNPLKFDNINALVCAFLSFLQGFIVVLALIMIVIGGFLYITSAGVESRMTLAKNTILGALIGLALGIATPAILKEIGTILGWAGFAACAGVGTVLSLIEIATKVLDFLLATVGVVSLIMLIVGAFMYLTAAGDESRIDTGKSIVKYAIIGITIALAALVLVRLVAGFF